jgi:outer membrane lipoprotein-sorting protein
MKLSSLVLCALVGAANLPAENIDAILARMDEAAASFRSMAAEVKMTTFTKVISDETVETGKLEMQRQKDKNTRAVINFSGQSDARVIAFSGNTVRIYYPKLKLYQDYDVGKSSDVLNQFLLLGFGSSGKELMASYDITSGGTESISGQETTKLLLVPKTPKVKEKLSKVEMWISHGATYPLQQQFFEPSGNYRIVSYSGIKLNPSSIKGNLEFKLPPGTKKQGS